MPGELSSLIGSPWAFAIVALSVLLDVFLPVLPSGVLLISAATAGTSSPNTRHDVLDMIGLLLCAASASCVGDLAAYRLAWHGGGWLDRRMARSRRLAAAQDQLGLALSRGGGTLVLVARFAPAGRSVVSLGAGVARRRPGEFLPWSALAGLVWATFGIGVGYLGGRWFGATWLGTATSVAALLGAGAIATYVFRREPSGGAATARPTDAAALAGIPAARDSAPDDRNSGLPDQRTAG